MIEKAINALLRADATVNGLVGGRISPAGAPQGTAYPYLIYQRISTERVRSTEGPSQLAAARIQVTVYDGRDGAEVALSVAAIAEAVRQALDGFPHDPPQTVAGVIVREISLEDERDQPAPPRRGRRKYVAGRSLDFLCWWQEAPVTHI